MITRQLVILALALLPGSVLWGATADGGRESAFTLGMGAQAIGMGGGFTSLASDPSAVYYNPSALAGLSDQQASFTHTVLFENSIYDAAAWVYPITPRHGLGVGFMRLGTGDLVRREDFVDLGRFDYSQSQMLLSYGRVIRRDVTGGLTLKIVHQSLDNSSDFGVGMDAGFGVHLYRGLSLGVIARDLLQAEMKLDEITENVPLSVAAGLSWRRLAVSPKVALSVSLALEKHEDKAFSVRTGGELRLHDAVALRLGYDRDNVAFGAGLEHGRLDFDYAYKLTDYLDDVHHFTVSFKIGPSMAERTRRQELANLPPEPTEEEKRFRSLMETANQYFRRFQLDSATYFFKQALELQPNNEEIIGTIASIEEARRVQREKDAALRDAQEDVVQTINSFLSQAQALYDARNYRAARDLLKLIFDVDPENPGARDLADQIETARSMEIVDKFEEARKAVSEGRLSDAVDAYNRILEIDPQNAGATQSKKQVLAEMDIPDRVRAAVELFNKGRLDDARRRFQTILEINPDEPVAKDYLGRIREMQKKTTTATLEDIQKDPVYWELYLEGMRHMRNKDYQKAIEAWQKVLDAYPNNPNTLNNIEQARLRLGTPKSGN